MGPAPIPKGATERSFPLVRIANGLRWSEKRRARCPRSLSSSYPAALRVFPAFLTRPVALLCETLCPRRLCVILFRLSLALSFFSSTYELPFPQPLSFHNHLRCRGGLNLIGGLNGWWQWREVAGSEGEVAVCDGKIGTYLLLFRAARGCACASNWASVAWRCALDAD